MVAYFQGEHLFVLEGDCHGIARIVNHSLPPGPEEKGNKGYSGLLISGPSGHGLTRRKEKFLRDYAGFEIMFKQ